MKTIVKVEIKLNGKWIAIQLEDLKYCEFDECRVTETMSREEYEQLKSELDL